MKNDNKDFLISRVSDTIKEHNLVKSDEGVVVGVSGGPDSVCLLHVLQFLADDFNIRIYAVHVNHMLRGKDSMDDEIYVKQLCKDMNVPLYSYSVDIKKVSEERGISLEEAGREVRYEQFQLAVSKFGANKVAVAHNRNDQAETVLWNILRGAGLDGLKGMEYIRRNIIRPLLKVRREHIEEYCNSCSLNPRIDRSNMESIYTRNKIRLALIPHIDKLMEVDSVESVFRMSLLLKDDYEFIRQYVEKAYRTCVINRQDEQINLDISKLKEIHVAVQKRVIREAVRELKGDLKGIESIHVESIAKLYLNGRTGAEVHLPHSIRAARSYNKLKICKNSKRKKQVRFNKSVKIPGITGVESLNAYVEALLEKRDKNVEVYANIRYNSFEQVFDYDKLIMGINIRNREPGDIFKPLKSNGAKKLKEYFINKKIPREEREIVPLLAKGNDIIWVIGYKISDKFKVTENTKTIVRLKYKKMTGYG